MSFDIDPMIEILAEGYGLAQRAGRMAQRVSQLLSQLNLTPDTTLVVERGGVSESYDEDWGDYRDREYHKVENMTAAEIVEQVVEDAFDNNDRWNAGHDDGTCGDGIEWEKITNLTALANALDYRSDSGWASINTVEGYEKSEQEKRRESLEQTAACFAAECGHKVGTREFVKAAKERIENLRYDRERWDSDECRMERFAACSFAGVRNAYFEDNDYMSGKFAEEGGRLEDVLDYMRDNFPLLMLHIDQDEDEDEDGEDC